jgi:hypothetical protein
VLFGTTDTFAIEYNIINHPYGDEHGLLLDSWGEMRLWVEGIDLLETYEVMYNGQKKLILYQWNLNMIIEWLAANLHTIITPVDFPNNIDANNAMDYLNQNRILTPDIEKDEFWEWHENSFEWLDTHWFRGAADGSNLPHLFFRRVNNNIEICWNNEGLFDDRDIYFCSQQGCKLVDMNVFYKVVKDFINNFIARFKDKYPVEMKELQANVALS